MGKGEKKDEASGDRGASVSRGLELKKIGSELVLLYV